VLDSSDGQLARMTGRSSDFGRLIDGVSGYITYVVVYLAIVTSAWSAGSGWPLVGLTALAGLSTIVHAQMYDYHRTTYVSVAVKGEPTRASIGRSYTGIVGVYESMQRAIAGRHPAVEQAIASRAYGGAVLDADRQRYRETFHWPVRGWNLFGDNTRIYAIGVLAWIGHVQWFPIVELLPMNVAFIAVWLWQQRADRRFLSV
jgi:phosphatidylglycerophosphate synthase